MTRRRATPIYLQGQQPPVTPPAGSTAVYAKPDGKVYRKGDDGTETELGGGLPYTPGMNLLEGVTASDWTFAGGPGSATVAGLGNYSLEIAGGGWAQLDIDVPAQTAVRYWILAWGGSIAAELRLSGGSNYYIDLEGEGVIPPRSNYTLGFRIYAATNSTVNLLCGFDAFSVVDDYEVQFWDLYASRLSARSVALESQITVPTPVSNQTVYYSKIEDGISSLWSCSPSGVEKEVGTPVGVVNDWAGLEAKVPEGWMLCDGRSLSKAGYPLLYDRIGDTYGSTSTTFNIPDHRGRVSVAPDNMGGVPVGRIIDTTLGGSGGEETVTLTTAQIPSHTHGNGSLTAASSGAHTHTTNSAGSHTHTEATVPLNAGSHSLPVFGLAPLATSPLNTITNSAGSHSHTAQSAGAHTHNVTGSTGAAGSGNAHNNMQPYIIQNKIIKVLPG